MVDWNGLAAQKYAILQQNADAHSLTAGADANLAYMKARLMPAHQAGELALQAAQRAHLEQQTSLMPMQSIAAMDQQRASADASRARAYQTNTQTDLLNMPAPFDTLRDFASSYGGYSRAPAPAAPLSAGGSLWSTPGTHSLSVFSPPGELAAARQKRGYSKGTAKVPGKGDGTKDTVDAKLAPGEAVLNKGAAEGVGRGVIEMLNALGLHAMAQEKTGGKGMPASKQKAS